MYRKLQSRLGSCFKEVRIQLRNYGERQRRYYNLSIHGTEYKPRDLVYLREKINKTVPGTSISGGDHIWL